MPHKVTITPTPSAQEYAQHLYDTICTPTFTKHPHLQQFENLIEIRAILCTTEVASTNKDFGQDKVVSAEMAIYLNGEKISASITNAKKDLYWFLNNLYTLQQHGVEGLIKKLLTEPHKEALRLFTKYHDRIVAPSLKLTIPFKPKKQDLRLWADRFKGIKQTESGYTYHLVYHLDIQNAKEEL